MSPTLHWGWQWYAGRAGMVQYDRGRSGLRAGDVVVIPDNVYKQEVAPEHRGRLRPIDDLVVESTPWRRIRTMTIQPFPYVGYYATYLRTLPWTWSRQPLERLRIYHIEPSAESQ